MRVAELMAATLAGSSSGCQGGGIARRAAPPRWCLLLRLHELAQQRRNLICFGIKREVSCVQNSDLRVGDVFAVTFGLADIERRIVLAPEDQKLWPGLLQPGLPLGIRSDIRAVVVEQIGLNLRLSRGVP